MLFPNIHKKTKKVALTFYKSYFRKAYDNYKLLRNFMHTNPLCSINGKK